MLDHLGLNVSDYDRSRDFHAQALAPLGFTLLLEPVPRTSGYYGAFVLDPGGNNVEAVSHGPE